MSPALAGEFFTTEPPRKTSLIFILDSFQCIFHKDLFSFLEVFLALKKLRYNISLLHLLDFFQLEYTE